MTTAFEIGDMMETKLAEVRVGSGASGSGQGH